jgi:hypothetical protein
MTAEMAERHDPWERHWTLDELAERWHVSRPTLRSWFANEPGVLRWPPLPKLKKGRQRVIVSLRVPESVAERVYRRRTGRYPASGN